MTHNIKTPKAGEKVAHSSTTACLDTALKAFFMSALNVTKSSAVVKINIIHEYVFYKLRHPQLNGVKQGIS